MVNTKLIAQFRCIQMFVPVVHQYKSLRYLDHLTRISSKRFQVSLVSVVCVKLHRQNYMERI